jgi:hypothetical protein
MGYGKDLLRSWLPTAFYISSSETTVSIAQA